MVSLVSDPWTLAGEFVCVGPMPGFLPRPSPFTVARCLLWSEPPRGTNCSLESHRSFWRSPEKVESGELKKRIDAVWNRF